MCLRAPDDDAVRTLVDDAKVGVGVGLLGRAQAAIAFDVCLGHRQRQVPVAAGFIEAAHAVAIVLSGAAELGRDDHQGEHGVGADFLDQRHRRLSGARDCFNQFTAREQVLVRTGDEEVAADRLRVGSIITYDILVASLGWP